MTQPSTSPPIVIIGGGPAGMFLAYLLVQNGIAVHVIERHPDFGREFRGEGIQLSVVRQLRALGLLDDILRLKLGHPAVAARVFLDDEPAVTLEGEGDDAEFGLILHQERFLKDLYDKLQPSPLFTMTFGASASDFGSSVAESATDDPSRADSATDKRSRADSRIDSVKIRQGTTLSTVQGETFVVATGRGVAMRKRLNIESDNVDTHFNILWLRLPPPADASVVPDGFRAHIMGDALFILYVTSDGGIQLAWGRRDEAGLKERSFEKRKAMLLDDAPESLRAFLEKEFTPDTVTHFLKVQSDRAREWFKDGVLLIGDAAHTMSPVAGQGINLAMRDAVVAANAITNARIEGRIFDNDDGADFFRTRIREVTAMQTFQAKLGYFMLGAPHWQIRLFFKFALPVLGALGIRQRLLRRVQAGVSDVEFVPRAVPRQHPSRPTHDEKDAA